MTTTTETKPTETITVCEDCGGHLVPVYQGLVHEAMQWVRQWCPDMAEERVRSMAGALARKIQRERLDQLRHDAELAKFCGEQKGATPMSSAEGLFESLEDQTR